MSTEPTDTLQPRDSQGAASRSAARGRGAGRGGRLRLEAPPARRLALPTSCPEDPAPSNSMIGLSAGDSVEAETKMDDDQAAPAAGSQQLTSVGSQLTAAPPASSGNAGTRSVGPTTLAARTLAPRAAEQSVAMSAPLGDADRNPVSLLTTPAAEQSVANPSTDWKPKPWCLGGRRDPALRWWRKRHSSCTLESLRRRHPCAKPPLEVHQRLEPHSPRPSSASTQTLKWRDGSPEVLEWCHPRIRTIRNNACRIG
ncbi:hypothetical protein PHYPSEUDO_002219 [Phytophthora pseudosyringae]|uniref:Uncharacterized protein n=1 Tax=Phytophthora pseudosyringae TaxID=221518 RepID=A0A8T1V1U0_9STRA|nr:hypothetical protein PHYPSEUDO_002219 [Phytophthora pseudosyringae]